MPPVLLFSPLVAVLLGYAGVGVLPGWHWLFYPGLAIWVAGWLFTCWPIRTMGRFAARSSFLQQVEILPDHHVVDTGPYRSVRHPIYAGTLLAFIGIGLALQSWVALLLILGIEGAGVLYMVAFEENFLVAELGEQYPQYMKRTTKRLIPLVW